MKIIRHISSFPPVRENGPAFHAQRLTRMLSKRNHECTVISHGGRTCQKSHTEKRDGYTIKWYPSLYSSGNIVLAPSLLKISLKHSPDLIHIHDYRSFESGIVARIANIREIPIILTAHGSVSMFQYLAQNAMEKIPYHLYDFLTRNFIPNNAEAIVATCEHESRQMQKYGIDKRKISVIPHGVDPSPNLSLLKQTTKKNPRPTVLFVGRISLARNLPLLLNALTLVKDEIPDVLLVICGNYTSESSFIRKRNIQRNITTLIHENDLKNNIEFRGWMSRDNLWKEYLQADIFAWPSMHDNYGHALVEASICGLPIVSTSVGVAAEVIGNNKGGFLVDKYNHALFAERIIELFMNKSKYDEASEFIQKQSQKFSAKKMVDSYEELYSNVISRS